MPFLPPRPSAIQKKRKSDGDDTDAYPIKRHAGNQGRDVQNGGVSDTSRTTYWNVQWRAHQTKKHKTWDGDAIVAATSGSGGSRCILYDGKGNVLGASTISQTMLKEGDSFRMGEKELEVDFSIPAASFFSGECFGSWFPSALTGPSITALPPSLARPFAPVKPRTFPVSSPSRRPIPLQPVNLIDISSNQDRRKDNVPKQGCGSSYWTANWRKSASSSKKNRSWEQDGYVMFADSRVTLLSEVGKIISSGGWKGGEPYPGHECYLFGKEVRLDTSISASAIPNQDEHAALQGSTDIAIELEPSASSVDPPFIKKFSAPASFYALPQKSQIKGPRHDPAAEGAVVMKAPSKNHEAKHNKKNLPVIPVVIDPILSRFLRPHQIDGVKFLYECVMGMRKHEGHGCILADEMGMGKTLQTISLVWTLLKQNPYAGNSVIGKCLVACPVSLVNNWKNEFHKWIGRDRIGIFVGDKDKSVIKQFVNSKIHQVLIIGYERLKGVIGDLAYCNPPIGLIICDEGHRLKSAQSKVNQMFDALKTPRRIILSGTPIQNNLEELHAMADFCNPGLLDDYVTFKRLYETPILKSRTPGCSSKDLELGNARSAQLLLTTKSFVLRRDASILANYLPPKFEYVVFVKPSALQLSIFAKILQQDSLNSLIRGSTARTLALINNLTKISNSPILLQLKDDEKDKTEDDSVRGSEPIREAMKLLPPGASPHDVSLSGKLVALANILRALRKDTDEKCIIVSHYTSTLDVIQAFCDTKKYTYNRLDGRTQVSKRQEYVDGFNKSSQSNCFIFLLSAKAGGVGLNLIGASRLVLVDSDWNPSHDLQAMARIHRDGQKRPVYIYRLLTTGTIDEKIYQRQITKMGLSDSLMANQANESGKSKSDSFSPQELRNLFTIYSRTPCHTHDLLGCQCSAASAIGSTSGLNTPDLALDSDSDVETGWVVASQVKAANLGKAYVKKKKAELASLDEWTHVNCMIPSARGKIHDDILRKLVPIQEVTQLEETASHPTPPKSRAEMLLAAVDSPTLFETDDLYDPELCSMEDVPGGQLTYLFERKSDSTL
ncbi:SNF2 family N-terminal domain-containing protein [Gautieria morchelliformis]|nr:SNF2 family N-terminal domain-containing protein [Gautieria morchelliformis]